MTGTLINVVAVLLGGSVGALAGNRLPERVQETVVTGLGLLTLVIGMDMALKSVNILIPTFSILLGGILGELLQLDHGLESLGRTAEKRFGHRLGQGQVQGWSVTQAFVTTSLLFCVGPMTFLGSIQDGLLGDYQLLAVKSTLDGFAAVAFAATLGPGVLLSAATVAIVQGGIAGAAMVLGSSLGQVENATPWVVELTATGGILILGIALDLLNLKHLRVANLLPALVIAPAIVALLALSGLGA